MLNSKQGLYLKDSSLRSTDNEAAAAVVVTGTWESESGGAEVVSGIFEPESGDAEVVSRTREPESGGAEDALGNGGVNRESEFRGAKFVLDSGWPNQPEREEAAELKFGGLKDVRETDDELKSEMHRSEWCKPSAHNSSLSDHACAITCAPLSPGSGSCGGGGARGLVVGGSVGFLLVVLVVFLSVVHRVGLLGAVHVVHILGGVPVVLLLREVEKTAQGNKHNMDQYGRMQVDSGIHEFRGPPCTSMIRVHGRMPTSVHAWSVLVNEVVEQRSRVQVLGPGKATRR